MKITRIRITSYRGIEALDATIPPSGVIASGKNGAGKTSLLRAIRAALSARDIGPDAIRAGAERAEILIDLDDITVRRLISKGGSSLTVETAAGDVKKKPQTWLTQILGTSALDPLDLFLADKKRRVEIVVGAMPTKLTEKQLAEWSSDAEAFGVVKLPSAENLAQLPGLLACETVHKAFYESRATANASVKAAEAERASARAAILKRQNALPTGYVPVQAEKAEAELTAARDALSELQARGKRAAAAGEKFASTRARIASIAEDTRATREDLAENPAPTKEAIDMAEEESLATLQAVGRLKEQLAAAETKHAAALLLAQNMVKLADAATDKRARLEQLDREAKSLEEAVVQGTDIAPTAEELEAALTTGKAARFAYDTAVEAAAIERALLAEQLSAKGLADAEAHAGALTKQVDFWRLEAPRRLLAEAQGIEGLAVDGDTITLDGVSIDALSGREQMRLAVEIARRANATTKLLVVDGLERLDPEQLEAFVHDATRESWQLLATRVDRGGIVLEAIEAEEAEAAQ